MANANEPSNTPAPNADDQAAKDAAAKAAADKEAADKAEADKKAEADAAKKAEADQKAADKKAKQDAKLAAAANAPQATPTAPTPAVDDGEEAPAPKRVVNDPTQNNRNRSSDIQVLIDAMPDELYDTFVVPHNLDSRGVDEETGFDLRKISNPTLDSLRLRLREQGYNV